MLEKKNQWEVKKLISESVSERMMEILGIEDYEDCKKVREELNENKL